MASLESTDWLSTTFTVLPSSATVGLTGNFVTPWRMATSTTDLVRSVPSGSLSVTA